MPVRGLPQLCSCTTSWSTIRHSSRQSFGMSVSASALLHSSPVQVADWGAMPARRQPQPRKQPALQLHDTMRISLPGAGSKSVRIGRREPLDRIHPHAVRLMLLLNLTVCPKGILTGSCTGRRQVCHLENTVH